MPIAVSANLTYTPTPLRWFDKLVLLAALAIAVAIFLSIGWMAVAPADPQGAVSLTTHQHAGWMALQVAALTAVTAAIATVMIGPKLVDVGAFAAALGMAFATLRGDTAAYLLIHVAQGESGAQRSLAAKLAAEGLVWYAMVLLAVVVSGAVMRWCYGSCAGACTPGGSSGKGRCRVSPADMAISDVPIVAGALGIEPDTGEAGGRWRATVVTAVVAAFLFTVLVSGSSPRAIEHGQTCFAVFTAFYLGVWASKRSFPARTPFWTMLAVPLVGVLGYLWAMTQRSAGAYAHLANIPPSDFLRALPMTFIAVGTLGVLCAHWTITDAAPKASDPSTKPARRSRR